MNEEKKKKSVFPNFRGALFRLSPVCRQTGSLIEHHQF